MAYEIVNVDPTAHIGADSMGTIVPRPNSCGGCLQVAPTEILVCYFLKQYKKLSYCWETVRRESMPRIAEMDVEMTT